MRLHFKPNPAILSDKLSEQYRKLADYMGDNKLVINDDKTHLLVMGGPKFKAVRQQVNINTGTVSVTPVETDKLLGLNIHQSLKWRKNIISNKKSMIKSLTTRLNALKKLAVNANFKTRLMVANSCFMSIIIYMVSVWGGTEDYIVKAVQVMQNKAARCVTKQSWFTPIKRLLLQCNWLSIKQLIFFHTALQVWRVNASKCPVYIETKLQLSRTRSSAQGNLLVPVVDNSVSSKSFMVRSAVTWKQIPAEIRSCKRLETFKKNLKQLIKANVEIT